MGFPEPIEYGARWDETQAVAILLHCHGRTPKDMVKLAAEIDCANVRYILPGADGATWYPRSLVEAFEENEPELKRALAHLGSIVEGLRGRGVVLYRIVLGGFGRVPASSRNISCAILGPMEAPCS